MSSVFVLHGSTVAVELEEDSISLLEQDPTILFLPDEDCVFSLLLDEADDEEDLAALELDFATEELLFADEEELLAILLLLELLDLLTELDELLFTDELDTEVFEEDDFAELELLDLATLELDFFTDELLLSLEVALTFLRQRTE